MKKSITVLEAASFDDRLAAIRNEAESVHAEAIKHERKMIDERIVSLASNRIHRTIDALLMVE